MRDQTAKAHGAGGGLARFWRDESGATAIEYAMMAAGIGGAVVAAVFTLGTVLKETYFDAVLEGVTNPTGGNSGG